MVPNSVKNFPVCNHPVFRRRYLECFTGAVLVRDSDLLLWIQYVAGRPGFEAGGAGFVSEDEGWSQHLCGRSLW